MRKREVVQPSVRLYIVAAAGVAAMVLGACGARVTVDGAGGVTGAGGAGSGGAYACKTDPSEDFTSCRGTFACEVTVDPDTGFIEECDAFTNVTSVTLVDLCPVVSACPTVNVLGRCTQTLPDGSTDVATYYSSTIDTPDAQALCAMNSGVWTGP